MLTSLCRVSRPFCRLAKSCKQRSYQNRLLLPTSVCKSLELTHQKYSTEAIPEPQVEGQEKYYSQKLENVVEEISNLTLLEVADLNELLKKRLNIADVPMMPMGGMPLGVAPVKADEEEIVEEYVKSLFTVRLTGFEQAKKVSLIKQIKAILPDTNLVQAKKFVENTPQAVKAGLAEEEAAALKKTLEEAGGTVEVD